MAVIKQFLPLWLPRPPLGKVEHQSAGPAGDPGWNGHQCPPDRRGGGLGHPACSDNPGGTGEIKRHDRAYEPGTVGGERPRRQMRQRACLQVCVDLFNDRVLTVGFIRSNSIQHAWVGGGEDRMEAVKIKQARLIHILLIQLRNPAYHQASGNMVGLLPGGKRGERHFGDLG